MPAPDRILSLLDANSFVEIGALVTKRNTDFNLQGKEAPSDGVITGYGVIHGRLAYVYGQDVSVMNGTMGEMHAKKIMALYDLALKVGAPVIGFVDCAGLRLQEATDALAAFGGIYLKQAQASSALLYGSTAISPRILSTNASSVPQTKSATPHSAVFI